MADRGDQRREQLLEVGVRLYVSRRYDDVAVDEIAATAGMSRGLLYHYFSSKQDFHLAVIDRVLADLREQLRPDPDIQAIGALQGALRRFFEYVAERGEGALAVLRGEGSTHPQLPGRIEEFREQTVDQVLYALREHGVDATAPGLRVAMRGWAGAVEGLAVGWLLHGTDEHDDGELTRLVELATAMLGPCLESTGYHPPRAGSA